MDERDLQLNNESEKVVAEKKRSRNVHVITFSERGETITIVACKNAEDTYLPPFCIIKGI